MGEILGGIIAILVSVLMAFRVISIKALLLLRANIYPMVGLVF